MMKCAIGVLLLVLPVNGTSSLLSRAIQRLPADVTLELRFRDASRIAGGRLHGIAAIDDGSRHGGAADGEGQVLCNVDVEVCSKRWSSARKVSRMAELVQLNRAE